jgi:hypothetical protein
MQSDRPLPLSFALVQPLITRYHAEPSQPLLRGARHDWPGPANNGLVSLFHKQKTLGLNSLSTDHGLPETAGD